MNAMQTSQESKNRKYFLRCAEQGLARATDDLNSALSSGLLGNLSRMEQRLRDSLSYWQARVASFSD